MFKKEVLIFFQGFFLQKLKAGGKKVQMNTHTHTQKKKKKEKERKRKDCFCKCQELINASFTDQKKNCDPYSKCSIELLCSYLEKFAHITVGE